MFFILNQVRVRVGLGGFNMKNIISFEEKGGFNIQNMFTPTLTIIYEKHIMFFILNQVRVRVGLGGFNMKNIISFERLGVRGFNMKTYFFLHIKYSHSQSQNIIYFAY
jgi:hypothetical protein